MSRRRATAALLALFACACGTEGRDAPPRSSPPGAPAPAPAPVPAPDLPEPPPGDPVPSAVEALSLGGTHACLLRADGSVRCWGGNQFGQLGDPSVERSVRSARPAPAPVPGLEGVVRLASGTFHLCALIGDGTLRCWGHNGHGQLGAAPGEDLPSPTPVADLAGVVEVAAGEGLTCARLADRTVRCFGRNDHGQLGDGSRSVGRAAPEPVRELADVVELAVGRAHACARLADGTLRCWGAAFEGQLGDGSRHLPEGSHPLPVPVEGVADARSVVAGSAHTCARVGAGAVLCWGENQVGQLGIGAPPPRARSERPVAVAGLSDALALTAGATHTCALRPAGVVSCWGGNALGQLGDGTHDARRALITPAGLVGVVGLGAGVRQTCALVADGGLRCWGENHRGQLGDGTTERRHAPVSVLGLHPAP